MDIGKRLAAECVGTALLLAISCSAGFAAALLAGGDAAFALMLASAASSVGLAVLIMMFGPVSGGLFNPVLTLSQAWRGRLALEGALPYVAAQITGAFLGAACAHAAFGMPWLAPATEMRTGPVQWLAEFASTFGLLAVFMGCSRSQPALRPPLHPRLHQCLPPFAVAAYVMAACCFSPSAAFMNPAMTLARVLGSGSGGIRLADAPAYILAQLSGAAAATALFIWLHGPAVRKTA